MFSLIERQDNKDNNDDENTVILRHDFQNENFTRMNSKMSVDREGCAAVVINNNNNNNNNDNLRQHQQQSNQVLVFGGGFDRVTDVVETCDVICNNFIQQQQHQQWKQLNNRMPIALRDLSAVNLKNNDDTSDKVYLFGGCNHGEGGAQNCCYEYDVTTDTYEIMPSMKTKRYHLTSVTIKNKYLFAIGGGDENDNMLDTVEYFDINNGNKNAVWCTLKAKMNKKRGYCCSASVDDIFYVIGGVDENLKNLDSIEMYDTSKQNSKFVLLDAKMKTAREGASAVVLGCYIIITCGQDENCNILNSIEIFNTKTQEFVDSSMYAFPTLSIPRSYLAAVLVDNDDDNNDNDALGMDTTSKKIVVTGQCYNRDEDASTTSETIGIKTTAMPISKFCFTKSNNDEYHDGKLPSDINKKILSFLLIEPKTKIEKKRKRSNCSIIKL